MEHQLEKMGKKELNKLAASLGCGENEPFDTCAERMEMEEEDHERAELFRRMEQRWIDIICHCAK